METQDQPKLEYVLLPADSLGAASRFFREALGLELAAEAEGRWLEFALDRTRLGIYPGEKPAAGGNPADVTSRLIIAVADVDEALARVAKHGGRVLVPADYEAFDRRLAVVADPAGNRIGLMENNP